MINRKMISLFKHLEYDNDNNMHCYQLYNTILQEFDFFNDNDDIGPITKYFSHSIVYKLTVYIIYPFNDGFFLFLLMLLYS